MWKVVRITVLLLILVGVAGQAWLDRTGSTSWREPLWVGIYPINGDGSAVAEEYVNSLTPALFTDIESFFEREAPRFQQTVSQPVRMVLYPRLHEIPPLLPRDPGRLSVALWSLKLRWFAAHAASTAGRTPPRVRLFVMYHDPALLSSVPDSHGMQKGLIGVVHAFADPSMAGSNNVVIAHELLHTLGATDKYEPGSGAPVFPDGFAEPDRNPRFPQSQAEIMAGRIPVSATDLEMPLSLRNVVVGPQTATEIRWTTRK